MTMSRRILVFAVATAIMAAALMSTFSFSTTRSADAQDYTNVPVGCVPVWHKEYGVHADTMGVWPYFYWFQWCYMGESWFKLYDGWEWVGGVKWPR